MMKKTLLTVCLLTTALCGTAYAETILSEDFEGSSFPVSWDQNSVVLKQTYANSGTNSAQFSANTDWLVSPPLTNAQTLTFWTYATSLSPTFGVETSTNSAGPWTSADTFTFTEEDVWIERNITLASDEILYIRFQKGGSGYVYIDDVSADDEAAGNIAPVLAEIGDQAVIVSNELTFTVSASDVNGDDIVLSAANLPSGATFTTVTNAAAVTNTFTWTEAAPAGTYSVTFFADDGTTNVSETISITVSAESVLPADAMFDFRNDADLYGALDDQAGPITYTNNGLAATFTASDGTMNRTGEGFGINAPLLINDTDAFDTGEWIDITFETELVLTNITVSSWNAGVDEAVIYVDGVSNGIITATGSHVFDIIVPSEEVLRISCIEGLTGNGWSLDSLAVKLYEPVAPVLEAIGDKEVIVSNSLSFAVIATDENNDDIILSASNLPPGAVFNTVTNAGAVTNTFSWTSAAPAGVYTPAFYADDGTAIACETITITVKEKPLLLLSEIADPAGTGGHLYRFVELYNAGTNTIDLAAGGWTLSMQDNGDSGDWRDAALTGSIGPAGTYVIANTSSNFLTAYGFEPDQADATVVDGNGRDTYALFYGGDHSSGTLIDIYGEIHVDGTNSLWSYEDDRAERNHPVMEPNPVWTASEWTLFVNAATNAMTPGIHAIPGEQPEISLTLSSGGPLTIEWPSTAGSAFNVLTNADLTNTNGWSDANLIPFADGGNYKVTTSIGTESTLFYKLESE
jgi:hypothetical protein